MSRFGGGGHSLCSVCQKKCYQNEGVDLDPNTRVHRSCFRCAQCRTTLTKRFVAINGQYYCEPHGNQILSGEELSSSNLPADAAAAAAATATSATVAAAATETSKSLGGPEIVNRTGGIELGGKLLFGIDAETALRRMEQYDLGFELECQQWIEAVLGESLTGGDTFGDMLRNGIYLCRLLNAIKPGTVPKINLKPIAMMQLENIRLFLHGCWQLGVPSGSLFTSNDLFHKADLAAVLQTILALGRIAQTIDSFTGPTFGRSNTGSAVRKHAPVEMSYLTKQFVQSTETVDSQAMRTQLLKLEEALKRERFQRALLEEQVKAGGSSVDAAGKLAELRAEFDAAETKRALLASEVTRLSESNVTLTAELEWERTKETRVQKVELHTIGSDGAPEQSREELVEEVANLEHAVKMLAQKRKSDVQKIREITARFDEASAASATLTARIATLESQLRESSERANASEQRAQSLMARLEELARESVPLADSVPPTPATGDDNEALLVAARAAREAREAEIRDILLTLLGSGPKGEPVDWNNDPLVDADDVRDLVQQFASDDGRRMFIKALEETLRISKARELAHRPFQLLIDILQALLSDMSRDPHIDFIGARVIMIAACELFHQSDVGEDPDFVQSHVRGHALWSSQTFWQDMFWEELLKKLRERKAATGDAGSGQRVPRTASTSAANLLSPRTLDATADDDDDDLRMDPEFVVNLLGVYASKMLQWGCALPVVEAFTNDVSEQTELAAEFREAMKQKLHVKASVIAMQQERMLRKKTARRSRAESLLLPSLSLRRNRNNANANNTATPPAVESNATGTAEAAAASSGSPLKK